MSDSLAQTKRRRRDDEVDDRMEEQRDIEACANLISDLCSTDLDSRSE
jgi:hypothetical protein